MTRTARSAVFLSGLLLVFGGLGAGASNGLGLASIVVGLCLIASSGLHRAHRLAAAIVLLVLAIEVVVVAAPTPVDWPMLGVAGLAVVAAVALLRSRGRAGRAA